LFLIIVARGGYLANKIVPPGGTIRDLGRYEGGRVETGQEPKGRGRGRMGQGEMKGRERTERGSKEAQMS